LAKNYVSQTVGSSLHYIQYSVKKSSDYYAAAHVNKVHK
jgi:hypothetical protein